MTDNPEFARWESRFDTPEYHFGKAPNEFLARCKPLLPISGTALAIADGEGRNGVWLAEQGLDVTSIDFSPSAQRKGRTLAAERGVTVAFIEADMHDWSYPESRFDVVAEIFAQISTPAQRPRKWAAIRRTLKSGGLLILEGYAPKQLQHDTGGPKQVERLYTRALLEEAFGDFLDLKIEEEEREMQEGAAHSGLSAVIHLTGRKP